jgi:hypothetical protein
LEVHLRPVKPVGLGFTIRVKARINAVKRQGFESGRLGIGLGLTWLELGFRDQR